MSAQTSTPMRVLLVQLADIGDLILTTPAIAALRAARPDAHLTLLTTAHSAPVLPSEVVDEVITLDRRQMNGTRGLLRPSTLRCILALRHQPFDAVIFFHHFTLRAGTLKFAFIARASRASRIIGLENGSGWFLTERVRDEGFGVHHQARYWLLLVERLGADAVPQRARIGMDAGILPLPATSRRRIVIHTGSGGYSRARRWPAKHFARTADALIEQHEAQVVFVGTSADGVDEVMQRMQHRATTLVNRTSLTQLADVLRSADLYIGADSGVTHMAAAVGIPVIALFGSSNVDAWGPWMSSANSVTLRSGPLCSPCSYVDHRIGARAGCAARTCMAMLTPEQVVESAGSLLRGEVVQPPTLPHYRRVDAPLVRLLGLDFHWLGEASYVSTLEDMLRRRSYQHVILCDYEYALALASDPILRVIAERAALVAPCGVGMSWAAGWTRQHLPQTLDAAALLAWTLQEAARLGKRVFLLGDSAAAAGRFLTEQLPDLVIAGALEASARPKTEADLVQTINRAAPDLILTGWPRATGDRWLARNSPRLQASVVLSIGTALMRDLAGRSAPVPELIADLRLGWLYLLLREPRRLRALWRAPRFILRVILKGKR